MPKTITRAQALAILGLVSASVLLLDQLIKLWVVSSLTEGDVVPILGPVLQLRFVRNPGAAFSLASGMTGILTAIALVVVIIIIWAAPRIRSRAWALMLGMLLGGVLGNLTDRLFREPKFGQGHVIDYIQTPWLMPAIYNIADIAILSSMGLFLILTIRGVKLDGTRESRGTPEGLDESLPETPGAPEQSPT